MNEIGGECTINLQMVFVVIPEGKRLSGRGVHRWQDNIKKILKNGETRNKFVGLKMLSIFKVV